MKVTPEAPQFGPLPHHSRSYLQLGAIYLGRERCFFRVWAPLARRVEVLLVAPRQQALPLERQGDYFVGEFAGIPPGSRYYYRLDGARCYPDPASRCQPQGVHGPSAVVDLSFPWEDEQWAGLPAREYVIYELHVGTFSPAGTLTAILPRLPELRRLGITAIELMPVAHFPGARNWGYDGVYPFAVHEAYGGPRALQELVNACHKLGLAVILDVVYNHLGPEGNYLWAFGPYFASRYQTPWGSALNFDGPDSDPVREYFLANALQWLRDFHIDALRLDAIEAITDLSPNPFLRELAALVQEEGARLGRQVFLMAESDRNDIRHLQPLSDGGCGLHFHWHDEFHHALHVLLTGEQHGYYQDFGTLADLARAYRQGFVYQGQYSRYRRRRHGSDSSFIQPYRFIAFAQNHDQVGNRPGGERLSRLLDLAGLKLAAAAVLLSPFTPLLFMGEEWGAETPFYYFTDHTDPELVAAVRRGRAASLGLELEQLPDPQAEHTFLQSRPVFDPDNHRQRLLWDYHRELLRWRRHLQQQADLGLHYPRVWLWPEQNLLLLDYRGSQRYLVALNFSRQPAAGQLPAGDGSWRLVFNSAAGEWGGQDGGLAAVWRQEDRLHFQVPALTCLILWQEEV